MNFYEQKEMCDNLKFEIIKLSDYNNTPDLNENKCNINNLLLYGLIFLLFCYVMYNIYDYFVNNSSYLNDDEYENENNELTYDQQNQLQVQQQQNQPQVQQQQQQQPQVQPQQQQQQLLDKYNQLLELQKQINDLMQKKQ